MMRSEPRWEQEGWREQDTSQGYLGSRVGDGEGGRERKYIKVQLLDWETDEDMKVRGGSKEAFPEACFPFTGLWSPILGPDSQRDEKEASFLRDCGLVRSSNDGFHSRPSWATA